MQPKQSKPIVFFSWQSDIGAKTNRNVISNCLRDICKKNSLIFDEATAERCGSPDIASTIEEKIRNADIFVADVTIINAGAASKTTPNPNVLFELGIAQATLGWDRIILIVNTAYAPISNLPFDIRSHRALSYSLNFQDAESLTNKQKTLRIYEQLNNGILSILDKNPQKEILKRNHSKDIQHNRDANKLERLLNYFFFSELQSFCENGPKYVSNEIINFQQQLNIEIKDPLFIFFDKELETLILNINEALNKSIPLDAPYIYNPSTKKLVWNIPMDVFKSTEDEKKFHVASASCLKLGELIKKLVKIIHERYQEIDINETNERAFKFWHESVFPKGR
ncbi:TIR domain-containing protein [Fibrobacter sp. UWB12]|uniref:TIR domain-containing protein n=1 Tax=Fibrobacter sp. UWB12 TaxID=1896203 RepID=UPI00091F6B21|nr:TIR domain-containing protein [Fibrobacter sp. UWB12]SHK89628.1 Predicted nucleotide-binding protein containing TIR-like domain-containing protein [Fibrobacter sp. UWB12]